MLRIEMHGYIYGEAPRCVVVVVDDELAVLGVLYSVACMQCYRAVPQLLAATGTPCAIAGRHVRVTLLRLGHRTMEACMGGGPPCTTTSMLPVK